MVSELVKRLRERRVDYVDSHAGVRVPGGAGLDRDCVAAADEIERLERERDEAVRKSEIDQRQCDEMTSHATQYASLVAALREAVAKLDDTYNGRRGPFANISTCWKELDAILADTAAVAAAHDRARRIEGATELKLMASEMAKKDEHMWSDSMSANPDYQAQISCGGGMSACRELARRMRSINPASVVDAKWPKGDA